MKINEILYLCMYNWSRTALDTALRPECAPNGKITANMGNRWFAQSTIRARARNIHRIAWIISYIARIIRWSKVNVITLSSVHRFNKSGARCSTNLAPLKCWGVEIVDFDL